jgi:predicted KAP-like P-loop ATPase
MSLYYHDQRIQEINEDKLQRVKFAESIARLIISWKKQSGESLVISLNGAWGDGKSSIKNLVKRLLKEKKDSPLIVEFNPWEWSSQGKIMESFFNELAPKIGLLVGDDETRRGFQALGKTLEYGKGFLDKEIPKFIKLLWPVAAILGVSPTFLNVEWFKLIAALLISLYALIVPIVGIWGSYCDFKTVSLDEQRRKIEEKLKNAKQQILVVIDDIDRLTAEQTRMIFQLVKANANFPNVIYLLLFQIDIVEKQLDDAGYEGHEYLEKIVQVPFTIPAARQSQINKVLFDSLNEIINKNKFRECNFEQNQGRWQEVFGKGVEPFFKNLRDVYRFLSTLSFYVSLFDGEEAYEANIVDLTLLEVLRVFEPAIYNSIIENSYFFTGWESFQISEERKMQEATKRIDEILLMASSSSRRRQEAIRTIIGGLFPTYSGARLGNDFFSEANKLQRVCILENFDKYFALSLSSDDISESEIAKIMRAESQDLLTSELETLLEQNRFKVFLIKLSSQIEDLKINSHFLTSLMDIGDKLDPNSENPFDLDLHMRAVLITEKFLSMKQNQFSTLKNSMNQTKGLSIISFILGRSDNEETTINRGFSFSDDELLELKQSYLAKVREIANKDAQVIIQNKFFYWILKDIEKWGEPNEFDDFVKNNIETIQQLLSLCMSLKMRQWSSNLFENKTHVQERISLKALREIVPLETVHRLISSSNQATLSIEEEKTLKLLQEELTENRSKNE